MRKLLGRKKEAAAEPDAAPAAAPRLEDEAQGRRRSVELAAYYRAERRGFAPGADLRDWLEAEAEVDAALRAAGGARRAGESD